MFMECKPGTCPVGKRCQNRRFQTKSGAPIEVFDADRKGFGLRTLCDLPAGAFVMEYVGDVITHRKFVRRAREYARAGHSHFYFMSLQPDQIIDAQQRGSLARFMNHSCAANCVTQKWVVGDHLRIGIFTTKPVKRGQELTFDYQFARYGDTAQACYCGESVCSGFIGGNSKDTRAAEAVAASMANDVLVNGDAILGDDNDDDDSDMDSDTSSKGGAHKRSRRDRDRQRSRKHQRAGMPARRDDTLDEGTLRRLLLPLVASVDSTTARELALAPSRVDSMLTKLLRIDSKAQKTAVDLNLGLPKVLRCVLDAAREHEALDDADESEEHLAASVGAVDPRSGGPAVTTRRGWAAAAATAAAETLSDVGSSGGSSSGGVDGATRRQTRATRWLRTSLEMLDALPVQTRNTLVAAGLPETMEEIKDHNDDVVSHLARVLAGKWAKLEQVWVIPRREIVPPSATAMDYSNARDEPPIKRMRVSAISTSMIGSHPPMSPASAGSGTPATPFTTVPPWSSSQSSQAPPPPPPLPAPTAPTPWRMYRAPAGYPFPQYYYHPMSSVTRWAQPQHCEIIDAMAKFGPDHRIPPPPPLPAGVFAAPVVSANTDVDDVADIIEAARRAAIEAEARTVRERQEREKTAAEEEEKRRRERRDLRNASSSSRRATSSSTAAGAGTGTKTSSSSSSRSKHHHHGSRSSKPPSKEASKEAAASESVDQIKIVPPPTGSTASATAPSSSATTTKEAYKRHPGWYRQLVSEYVVKQLTVHHRPRKTDPPRTYVHPLGTSDAFKAVARDLAHEILCRESVPDPSRPQLTNLSAALKAKIDKYVAAKVDRLKHTAKKTAKAAGAL
ncbi:hypothetical protein BC828DRAFT_230274 [Blastocladiella britannica]|nr:hypothetical protein BC828DRAFT_230274 [Blastocladiella britannica]